MWVCCYGILLHAWNARFFKEIDLVKGRLLKIDECTINKLRLDHVRILITTKLVGEINEVKEIWIDGKKYPIRFVGDLELGLVGDAC